ncbi:DUF6538 domain-containing protein [Palleronia sp.]|uniref:DUF6538 domain-containing protein n=1 Tax=Palleronia sp. TaxID=1940284 RepID=UPI0035C858B2
MGQITHVSRRGAVYVWRRRCPATSAHQSTGTLQVSLRTRELSTARRVGALVSNAAEWMYEGMKTQTITKDDVRAYLEAVVAEELQRIEGERWDESPAVSPAEWRRRWMTDRAEACALRLLAQRGQAADLMPEDMDLLRERGFRPDEMSLVLEQLFALKERFWGTEPPALAPSPEAVFGDRTITEAGYRHLRSAAFEGRARALEQSDRRAAGGSKGT